MTEITLAIVDRATGTVVVDDEGEIGRAAQADLANVLGAGAAMGCANPLRGEVRQLAASAGWGGVRIAGYWHDSLIEGPGRRSVVQFQGCPIRCHGCWVPETWDAAAGTLVDLDTLVDALTDPAYERDGVTIIGGEPFAQAEGLRRLLMRLGVRGIHTTVYTGYTLEALRVRATHDRDVEYALRLIDVLIDGPYIAAQTDGAGPWTGSGNQRVVELRR